MLKRLLPLIALAVVTTAQAALPAPVDKVLRARGLSRDAVSVVVQALDETKPRVALNAGKARNPASTIKLVTTWTALDVLGRTYRWPTEFYALGPIADGVLSGDLLVKGYGDPFLVLEDFWKMLGELRQAGLREIRGDLVIDDSAYVTDAAHPGDFDDGPHRLYNAVPTALTVNFNAVRFVLNPSGGAAGEGLRTIPALPNLRVLDRVERTGGECRSRAIRLAMTVGEDAAVTFRGKLPRACKDYELGRNVMSTADYAFGVFTALWAQWGGRIHGTMRRGTLAQDAGEPLLRALSRPLAEIVRPVNKWSNNVMARLLLFAIGAARNPLPVRREQGVAALTAHLAARGLDTSALVVDNGAGLSRRARLSATFMVDLLRHAWRQPTMPEFVSSMSIVGLDGTTRRRFRGAAEAGRMHVKTGMLRDVIALAGYVHARSGKVFALSLMVNDAKAGNGSGMALQDALLEWVHAQ